MGVTAAAITSYENFREGGIGTNVLKRPSLFKKVCIFSRNTGQPVSRSHPPGP